MPPYVLIGSNITEESYGNITITLQFCRNPKIHCKSGSHTQRAAGFNRSVMGFYNGFCKRETKTNTLRVLGKTAAIKPFKNVI